jgi:nitrite reductase (NADH) small subunit
MRSIALAKEWELSEVPFVSVLRVSELPPGSTAEVSVAEHHYVLCNLNGEIHALDGVCPCSEGPLSQGVLQGNLLVCPWHGRRYDCRTGVHHFDPEVRVAKFPVLIQNGDILIDVNPMC